MTLIKEELVVIKGLRALLLSDRQTLKAARSRLNKVKREKKRRWDAGVDPSPLNPLISKNLNYCRSAKAQLRVTVNSLVEAMEKVYG